MTSSLSPGPAARHRRRRGHRRELVQRIEQPAACGLLQRLADQFGVIFFLLEKLGAKLTKLKDLYQQGEFASEQLVTVIGPRQRIIPNVRILGPMRDYTQVELSYTDGIYLGIDLPLRISGNHEATPGCTIMGPKGAITINQGVIRAERHVHMSKDDMSYYGVADGDYMKLKIDGPCGVTFDRVKVRYHPKVVLEVHIDTDEGNACDLDSATNMELFK